MTTITPGMRKALKEIEDGKVYMFNPTRGSIKVVGLRSDMWKRICTEKLADWEAGWGWTKWGWTKALVKLTDAGRAALSSE